MTNVFGRLFGREVLETPPAAAPGLAAWFADDHRACDEKWVEVEQAIARGEPDGIWKAVTRFDSALRAHLAMEEDVLFPAAEQAGLPPNGPTRVMRREHDEMRSLLDRMSGATLEGRHSAVLDDGDTLLMLIQQHNEKEEGVLYPMAESLLGAQWETLRARLESYRPGTCCGGCGCG